MTLSLRTTGIVIVVLVTALVLGFTATATYQYVAFDRAVNQEVEAVLEQPEYAELRLVEVRTENQLALSGAEPGVTVVVSTDRPGRYPALPSVLQRAIEPNVERGVHVRVRLIEYRTPAPAANLAPWAIPSSGQDTSY